MDSLSSGSNIQPRCCEHFGHKHTRHLYPGNHVYSELHCKVTEKSVQLEVHCDVCRRGRVKTYPTVYYGTMGFVSDGNLESDAQRIFQCLNQHVFRLVECLIWRRDCQRTQFVLKEITDGYIAATMPANHELCAKQMRKARLKNRTKNMHFWWLVWMVGVLAVSETTSIGAANKSITHNILCRSDLIANHFARAHLCFL